MKNENNKNHGGSAFFWGLVIGALLASLLTTKRGRRILREFSEVAFDLIESFIEERSAKGQSAPVKQKIDEVAEVAEDLKSEIAEVESEAKEKKPEIEEFVKVDVEEKQEANGHGKKRKRLFRGIRK